MAELKKKIIMMQIVGVPITLCMGLGLYGVFGADGDAFLPLLNDQSFSIGLIVIGAVLELWQLSVIIPALRDYARLKQSQN